MLFFDIEFVLKMEKKKKQNICNINISTAASNFDFYLLFIFYAKKSSAYRAIETEIILIFGYMLYWISRVVYSTNFC